MTAPAQILHTEEELQIRAKKTHRILSKKKTIQAVVLFFSACSILCVAALKWQPLPALPIASDPKLRILIGILTTAAKFERRSLLRLAYGLQPSPSKAVVSVRFVVCRAKKKEEEHLVRLEITKFNDIIVLDCEENMNHGKSFTYFSTIPALGIRYDYVMKADDDAYIRIKNLAKSLAAHPRKDLYYGLPLPNDPTVGFMTGEGYAVSWDLVEWISESPIPRQHSVGKEDLLPKLWFNEGNKAKHRTNMKYYFYDHPDYGGTYAHDFTPDTILIHQLKGLDRWMDVLSYFELLDKSNSTTS